MSKRKYYKVCQKVDNVLLSMVTSNLQTVYRVGEKTVPQYGYLFAFSDRSVAEKLKCPNMVVYECHVEKARFGRYRLPFPSNADDIKEFWRLVQAGYKKDAVGLYGWGYPPEGTVFCKSITLLKEVNNAK